MGRIKPLPSIRVDGDTSKYVLGQHQNFNGNGHMRHPSKTYVDWKAKNWVDAGGMYQHFDLNEEGELTIKESGLYFIYAQVLYTSIYTVISSNVTLSDILFGRARHKWI